MIKSIINQDRNIDISDDDIKLIIQIDNIYLLGLYYHLYDYYIDLK